MRLEGRSAKGSTSPPHSLSNGSNGSNGHSPSLAKAVNGHGPVRQSNGTGPYKMLTKRWSGHDREEVARILIQGLTDLGYHNSAKALVHESNFTLDGPNVAAFRSAVLDGKWDEVEELLFGENDSFLPQSARIVRPARTSVWREGLTLVPGANRTELVFWIRQQKYLELLERGEWSQALVVLRTELTPLQQDQARVHQLAGYVHHFWDLLT
jgi:hypothetical protein